MAGALDGGHRRAPDRACSPTALGQKLARVDDATVLRSASVTSLRAALMTRNADIALVGAPAANDRRLRLESGANVARNVHAAHLPSAMDAPKAREDHRHRPARSRTQHRTSSDWITECRCVSTPTSVPHRPRAGSGSLESVTDTPTAARFGTDSSRAGRGTSRVVSACAHQEMRPPPLAALPERVSSAQPTATKARALARDRSGSARWLSNNRSADGVRRNCNCAPIRRAHCRRKVSPLCVLGDVRI